MVFRHFLINETRWFKMHGPKVSNNINIMSGPRRVEIKVVNQGECWKQDSNQPCWASRSLFHWASLSHTFWRHFVPPLNSQYRNSILLPVLHIILLVTETTNLNLSYSVTLLQPRSSRILGGVKWASIAALSWLYCSSCNVKAAIPLPIPIAPNTTAKVSTVTGSHFTLYWPDGSNLGCSSSFE